MGSLSAMRLTIWRERKIMQAERKCSGDCLTCFRSCKNKRPWGRLLAKRRNEASDSDGRSIFDGKKDGGTYRCRKAQPRWDRLIGLLCCLRSGGFLGAHATNLVSRLERESGTSCVVSGGAQAFLALAADYGGVVMLVVQEGPQCCIAPRYSCYRAERRGKAGPQLASACKSGRSALGPVYGTKEVVLSW
jgi:hypothetical protein